MYLQYDMVHTAAAWQLLMRGEVRSHFHRYWLSFSYMSDDTAHIKQPCKTAQEVNCSNLMEVLSWQGKTEKQKNQSIYGAAFSSLNY